MFPRFVKHKHNKSSAIADKRRYASVRFFIMCSAVMQWRNFGLKSEGDQAKVLTWYTYKVGVRPPSQKSGGPDPRLD